MGGVLSNRRRARGALGGPIVRVEVRLAVIADGHAHVRPVKEPRGTAQE